MDYLEQEQVQLYLCKFESVRNSSISLDDDAIDNDIMCSKI